VALIRWRHEEVPVARIRVASAQYWIRPIERFEQFADQVSALVETARDYKSQVLVFPEYFTTQLLTLGDVKRPIAEQVRHLTTYRERFLELMERLARSSGLHIVAGTIPVREPGRDYVENRCYVFAPSGAQGGQSKLHMTRFESEEWLVSPGQALRVFETSFGRIAVTICYDVEFPELARAAARAGALVLVVPSCTDDRHGFLRVRYCAQARCIENQIYAIQSCTVGSLPMVPAVSLNYGQASILTPSDFPFSRDGILAEGSPNQESLVIGDLDLDVIEKSRATGTVLPLRDSEGSEAVARRLDVLRL
jgi:predicted amidohydrolase